MKELRAVGAAILLALSALACGGGAQEGDGHGIVRGIAPDRGKVTLEHGEIPGLMAAMTMEFAVTDPSLLAGVEVGDEVDFRLRYADGVYRVTELREEAP